MHVWVWSRVMLWMWLCLVVGGVIALYWSPAAWCLRNEGVSSVLLGASNTDQLMENIGAIQVSVCVFVIMQRTVRGVFVRMCPDLLHQALYSCLLFRNSSPHLPSTLQPLGHCCTLWYTLLYCVNKVGRVSLAGGVGDKAAAISFSLDKMHSPNGLFWLVRVSLPSAHFAWFNKECVCMCACVCLLSYCVSISKCYAYISQGLCRFPFSEFCITRTKQAHNPESEEMRLYFYPLKLKKKRQIFFITDIL